MSPISHFTALLLSLYPFPSLSFSHCICRKNRWLFPLHCHQWGLIYDAHRVETPIKSLFTVKRQDHQKQRRGFNGCWHQLNVMRPYFPRHTRQFWADNIRQFSESMFYVHQINLMHHIVLHAHVKCLHTFMLIYSAANRYQDIIGKTLCMIFPPLNDTDCSVFIISINQSMLPPACLSVHSFS